VAGSVLLDNGCIPVALSKSEGIGSVWALVQLSDAHLYIQVLGNHTTERLLRARHTQIQPFTCGHRVLCGHAVCTH